MSIWKHKELSFLFKKDSNLVTFGEGDTALEEFIDGGSRFFIKREDKNPTGSWKDRASAFKLTSLINQGFKEATIASSGNAAISLLTYATKLNLDIKLNIVLGLGISVEKKDLIEKLILNTNHELYFEKNPKKKAAEISAQKSIINLKASIDNELTKSYWSLGFELSSKVKALKKTNEECFLLVPVSSGTSVVGLVEGLFLKLENEFLIPRIIMLQTQSCHPLIEDLPQKLYDEKSIADAIVDQSLLRKDQLIKILRSTNGFAYSVTNAELVSSYAFMRSKGIELSYASLLGIAAFLHLRENNAKANFIIIASGR